VLDLADPTRTEPFGLRCRGGDVGNLHIEVQPSAAARLKVASAGRPREAAGQPNQYISNRALNSQRSTVKQPAVLETVQAGTPPGSVRRLPTGRA
jgi:hypothetical protein